MPAIPKPRPARDTHPADVPDGLCKCGCGSSTNLIQFSVATRGLVKGKPYKFLKGHFNKPYMPTMYRVDVMTGCWCWTGRIDQNGYGRLGGKLAYRVIFVASRGPVPSGKQLDHLCRNRACVNPEHLEPVTQGWNIRRGKTAKLTFQDVLNIRRRVACGESRASLARSYGVSAQHVGMIVSGKKWASVT